MEPISWQSSARSEKRNLIMQDIRQISLFVFPYPSNIIMRHLSSKVTSNDRSNDKDKLHPFDKKEDLSEQVEIETTFYQKEQEKLEALNLDCS